MSDGRGRIDRLRTVLVEAGAPEHLITEFKQTGELRLYNSLNEYLVIFTPRPFGWFSVRGYFDRVGSRTRGVESVVKFMKASDLEFDETALDSFQSSRVLSLVKLK